MDDLPLFQWQPPCTVMVFPHEKRVGRIRHVAEKLSQRQGNAADAYWRQTVRTLAGQMKKAGVPDETIGAELSAFRDAVQGELQRIHCRRQDGGAA